MKYSDEIKLKILKYSLQLEKIASLSLAFILEVKDVSNSKSLGNKNTSISFHQKLNLLLDSGSIDKESKEKLEIFMEIRNQLMHNSDVNTFVDIFNILDGRVNRLKKLFPDHFSNKIEIENSFNQITDELYIGGIKTLVSFQGVKRNKINLTVREKFYKRLNEATPNAIDKAIKMLVDDIRNDEFQWNNKDILIENIKLLEKQIIVYRQVK